ncbi:glycerophosphodiester phosphodiesterase family protein [Anseongella ginsenosidimutans]|uniref:glycerophosphodiester phosphodiesterase family protein n=1 Tax=Anseongella ginsenosidimutans TaxID=496056 RepID=UPI001CEFA2F7|nr:glycerophosphodiester phosphodiesterase family protein [Anseongella ginsenosidimutans]
MGTIVIQGAEDASAEDFVLRGDNAGKFKIKKGNQLFIRGKYAKSAEKWVDLAIGTADGQLSADFRILKDQFHTNGVIAHRGAWKNTKVPQNSIASFEEAVKLGCEGSEFDVHLSADSVTILFHDRDKEGLVIEKTSYKDLSEERLSNGEVLPELVDFLKAAMNQNTTKMVLEIKPSAVSKERGIALTEMVVRQVREAKAQAWVDYISFGYDICQRLLELDPYANVAYLNGDKAPSEVAADKLFGLDYNQKVFREHPDWITEAKEQGLTLNVWTVNKAEDMDWFLEKEFDFITTDEPELLLEKVKK